MEAQAAGHGILEELLQLQTSKRHNELRRRLASLPDEQESLLWRDAFELVQTYVLQDLANEEGSKDDAVALVHLVAAAVKARVPTNPTFLLIMKHLHNAMIVVEGKELRESVLSLCEKWCLSKLPKWEGLWTNTFVHNVEASLQTGALKKHVMTVYQLKEGLGSIISLEDNDQKPLLELLSKCAASPNYLTSDKGRLFVLYLLKQKAVVVRAVYKVVDAAFPHMTRSQVEALASLYLSAWKARTEENTEALEEGIQDVMLTAVNGDLPTSYHENLHKFLNVFHSAWSNAEIAKMLFRLYQPVLWRGLKVPNCVVRKSAARVFFDAFPLLEHWQVDARELEMKEKCELIRFLLIDPAPSVRVVAVKGTMRALSCYYDLFPYNERRKIMGILLMKNGRDANSQDSRRHVLLGLEDMIKNVFTHGQLKSILPSTKQCLYDTAKKVRAAFVSLLFSARNIRGFAFTDVVGTADLLNALPGECTPVARCIVRVLHNTYFNPRVSVAERMNRCFALMERNRMAALKFYFELIHISSSDLILEFMLSTCTALQRNFGAASREKENTSPEEYKAEEDDDGEDQEEGLDRPTLTQEQVGVLVDTLAVMFTSMRNRVKVKQGEQQNPKWKLLHIRVKKTLRILLKNIRALKTKMACLYVASLLPDRYVAPTLGRQCLSLLENIARSQEATPEALALNMKACLYTVCRAHKAADVLSCVSDWLGKLHAHRTPKRKVRFKETGKDPGLGLDILQCLLEMTQSAHLLLKNHLVPMLDTWSVLLRVVATLQEMVCDPRSPRPDKLLFRAFDLYLRMTLLLSDQEHPGTKEKFRSANALTCQMEWIQGDLLPVIAVQTKPKQQDALRVVEIYLRNTIDTFQLNMATHEYAENVVDFLRRCRDSDVKGTCPQLVEVAETMERLKILFAGDEEKEASISTSLASLRLSESLGGEETEEMREEDETPEKWHPKERRRS